jgi:NAD(P)-dependent dehydrogenase (short-subunit alcohol dehydrogenase family)
VSGLLPLLGHGRVIFSSSAGHAQAPSGGVDYKSVIKTATGDGPGSNELNVWVDYGQSKWGDIALAKQVDKMHGPRSGGDLISLSVHPGESIRTLLADKQVWLLQISRLTSP